MKKIILTIATASLLACGSEKSTTETVIATENIEKEVSYNSYGNKIDTLETITTTELVEKLKTGDSLNLKVKGIVDEVCQMKGCWMDVKIGEDDYFTVRFKNEGFAVPKEITGKETIFEGVAFMDTITIEQLKQTALDEQQSDSVINAITEPEITLNFTANGVLIRE